MNVTKIVPCVEAPFPLSRLGDRAKEAKHQHVDEAGFAALHYAAIAGDVAVFQGLLHGTADVNSGMTRGDPEFHSPGKANTVLHLCAMLSRDEHALEFLLAQRANISIKDTSGCTALHMSCISGNRNAARVLLAHGLRPKRRGL